MTPSTQELRGLLERATGGPWKVARTATTIKISAGVRRIATLPIRQGTPSTDNGNLIVAAVNALPALLDRIERLEGALIKVNAIRNSIIGVQGFNWSEHAYPLVAVLDEAGFEGMPYPEARAYVGSLIERAVKAEDALAALGSVES